MPCKKLFDYMAFFIFGNHPSEFLSVQRTTQPLPQITIFRGGHVANKRFRRFSGYGKSAEIILLYKKALLASFIPNSGQYPQAMP